MVLEKLTRFKPARKSWYFKVFFAALCLMLSLSIFSALPEKPSARIPRPESVDVTEYDRVLKRFDAADRKLVAEAVANLDSYFTAAAENLEPFLDDIFSFESKAKMFWYLVTDFKIEMRDDFNPLLLYLVQPFTSIEMGEELPDFIAGKFDRYFGNNDDIDEQIQKIVCSLNEELLYNGGRLAVELGGIYRSNLGESNKIAAESDSGSLKFDDMAKEMTTGIVHRSVCEVVASELIIAGADGLGAKSLAAPLIAMLVNAGLITAEGLVASGMTLGVGMVVMFAADCVTNKISKSMLAPKIKQILRKRRALTIAKFKNVLSRRLENYHHSRRELLYRKLSAA